MNSKRIQFTPLGSEMTRYGELIVSQEGQLMYVTHEVDTGHLVATFLAGDASELNKLIETIQMFQAKHQNYSERMLAHKRTRSDFTPADQSFKQIMDSLIKGTKH